MISLRDRMRCVVMLAGLAIATVVPQARAQVASDPNSYPDPYHLVDGWAKLPGGRSWGSTNAVGVDSHGHIWIGDRCGANSCAGSNLDPILEFDAEGKLLKSFGAGMIVVPHAVYCDKDGNIWVSDNGTGNGLGQQVIKFSPEGKVLMKLGTAGVAGDGPDTFNQPDAVIVAPNGDIFVADGHTIGKGNARVLKFSSDGKFIKQWGEHGSGPGQFEVPHGLAMDSKGRLFVADRGNKRIQIFDQDGKFLEEWKQFGQPSGIFIDRKDTLYVADSQSTDNPGPANNPGFQQGIRIGSAKDGKVTAFIPMPPPPTGTNAPEGVSADSKGSIYAAFVNIKTVKKYAK